MTRALLILTVSALSFSAAAASAPMEVWLTPERKAALGRITARPRVISQERGRDGATISRWTNGCSEWTVTNAPNGQLGKRSVNAWQSKLDAKEKERRDLLDDLKAVKDKPTKAALDDILKRHGAEGGKK